MTKRLLKSAQGMELADFLDICASYQATCHYSQERNNSTRQKKPAES